MLLVTTFPLYCIKPFVKYTGLYQDSHYQYIEAIVLVHVLPLAFIAQTATVWSTVLIGVNRYIAVCHPYQVSKLMDLLRPKKFIKFIVQRCCIHAVRNILVNDTSVLEQVDEK